MNKLVTYIKEAMAEMKKVVWPTKKQTINYSIIVVALSIGTAVFFGFLDYVFSNGLEALLDRPAEVPAAPAPTDAGVVEAPSFEVTEVDTDSVPSKDADAQ